MQSAFLAFKLQSYLPNRPDLLTPSREDYVILCTELKSGLPNRPDLLTPSREDSVILCTQLKSDLPNRPSREDSVILCIQLNITELFKVDHWPNPICQEPSFIDQTGCLGKILDPLLLTRSVFSSGTSNFSANATVPGIILPLNYPQDNIVRPLLPPIMAKNQEFIAL